MKKSSLLKRGRYVLQQGDRYVVGSALADKLRLTDKREDARIFTGEFLLSTCWDWQHEFEAVIAQ